MTQCFVVSVSQIWMKGLKGKYPHACMDSTKDPHVQRITSGLRLYALFIFLMNQLIIKQHFPTLVPGTQSLCLHTHNIPYSEKDTYFTKLFTRLMKLNIPLIFLFTCSRAYSDYGRLFASEISTFGRLVDRANTASLFHSFNAS